MVDSHIDYDELEKSGNNSWTSMLIERIREDIDDAEFENIKDWMDRHEDFRAEKLLLEILTDSTLPDISRDRASLLLCEITTLDTAADRAEWWQSGEPILMRHAMRMAEFGDSEEASLIENVGSDSTNQFQSEAIKKLSTSSNVRFQNIAINALSHPDSKVRIAAAKSLIWEQPVAAESALLKAANDACEDVAIAALDTLVWYTSQNVLKQINALRCSDRMDLVDEYNNVFNYLLEDAVYSARDFENTERGRLAESYYQEWLEGLGEIFCFYESESDVSASRAMANARYKELVGKTKELIRESVSGIISKYSDPNRKQYSWDDGSYDWSIFSEAERKELSRFFMANPDSSVRKISARAFAEWNDAESLVRLMNDSAHNVVRYACYIAKQHAPNQTIANALLEILRDKQTTASFARETFASYVVHASLKEEVLIATLEDFVRNDFRQEVRKSAVWQLCNLVPEKINDLSPILAEPPMMTWSLHCQILEICNEQEIQAPNLESLLDVDDFSLQQELALMRANKELYSPGRDNGE